ncbi:HET-domain-containing protein [Mytilinidion resinicola]|uniref:HET-domain-containing protein n=1 Tax=Mytilinidion resinicola TaxID=574789 RepID=A0A6A6YB86_9PEZI|nr:HET-domain-containing protein [Mytilinidion resinicola]KAF2806081.1 HET-domain-containing protein [Mytilinidion resinicola]
MRLLRLEDFSLVEVVGKNIPRYAVLSHTWGPDQEEVTYKEIVKGTGKSKAGYAKIQFCGKQAAKDNLQYIWVDTCCINKSSSAELQEAINSMFYWYQKADKCYVYLSDVSVSSSIESDLSSQQKWMPTFQDSRWFTRGWTLQELLAPTSIEFFSAEGEHLGNRISLLQEIHDVTGISLQALQGNHLSHFSVNERMSWANGRETKREEDAAYSLLGIFDIHIPLIYGEGRKKALKRLHREIRESLKDSSPTRPPAAFSEHENAPKREKGTASIYTIIIFTL